MFGAKRLAGHKMRVDLLSSLMQKAVRRCDHQAAMYAASLLHRGGFTGYVVRRCALFAVEDSNDFACPGLKRKLGKLIQAALDLWKATKSRKIKNASVPKRRLDEVLFQIVDMVVRAPKSRMMAMAACASFKMVEDVITTPLSEASTSKQAVRDALSAAIDEGDIDKALLQLGLAEVLEYDVDDVIPEYKAASTLMAMKWNSSPIGHKRLLQLESVFRACGWTVKHDCEVKSSSSGMVDIESENISSLMPASAAKALWTHFMNMELSADTRLLLDWAKWLPIAGDKHTAIGKGHNTLQSLLKDNDFAESKYHMPDHSGYKRASPVRHFLDVGAAVAQEAFADPFADRAYKFYVAEEKQYGYRKARSAHIRKRLAASLRSVTRKSKRKADVLEEKGEESKKQYERKGSRASEASSLARVKRRKRRHGSADEEQGREEATDGDGNSRMENRDADGDVQMSASRPIAERGETKRKSKPAPVAPVSCEGEAVMMAQLCQAPCGWKPATWIVKTANNRVMWMKEMKKKSQSILPVYFDTIKPYFGLVNCHLRYSDGYLIGQCMSDESKFPYATMQHMGLTLIRKDLCGLVPIKPDLSNLNEQQRDELLQVLVFRRMFNLSDSNFRNIMLCEATGRVVSMDEMGVKTWKEGPLIDMLFAQRPNKLTKAGLTSHIKAMRKNGHLSTMVKLLKLGLVKVKGVVRPSVVNNGDEVNDNLQRLVKILQ